MCLMKIFILRLFSQSSVIHSPAGEKREGGQRSEVRGRSSASGMGHGVTQQSVFDGALRGRRCGTYKGTVHYGYILVGTVVSLEVHCLRESQWEHVLTL